MNRGRAHYFHGREQEIHAFQSIVVLSQKSQKGYTVLLQGAPGVGKTALLRELEKVGEKSGWTVATLTLESLWCIDSLQKILFGEAKTDGLFPSISRTIEAIQKPMLLVLDDAHLLGVGYRHEHSKIMQTVSVLNQLHNLHTEHGLILLMAGLTHTRSFFHEFRIIRFNSGCVFRLETLDKKAEKHILQDFLVKGTGVHPDHPKLGQWIHTLTNETHQWPDYLSCYGQIVSRLVQKNNGQLTEDVLDKILVLSREKKKEYYQGLFDEWKPSERIAISHALFDHEINENLISGVDALLDLKKVQRFQDPEKTFQTVISKGILQMRSDGFYQIPIPSLRTWMLQEYENNLKVFS
ncbi:MAG: ATP-binding protein [Flavobacteriaceae bacterium]|nr:ATP-binding protein [Flavobacteriaceae bacterium]